MNHSRIVAVTTALGLYVWVFGRLLPTEHSGMNNVTHCNIFIEFKCFGWTFLNILLYFVMNGEIKTGKLKLALLVLRDT